MLSIAILKLSYHFLRGEIFKRIEQKILTDEEMTKAQIVIEVKYMLSEYRCDKEAKKFYRKYNG
jgi:HEPN domain-containing protein